ncbi:hypothetical protein EJB05_40857, partial [Eragrostis curvula]
SDERERERAAEVGKQDPSLPRAPVPNSKKKREREREGAVDELRSSLPSLLPFHRRLLLLPAAIGVICPAPGNQFPTFPTEILLETISAE